MSVFSSSDSGNFKKRKRIETIFKYLCFTAALIGILLLITLLYGVAKDGIGRLNWDFITSFPSRRASQAGIKAALFGSLWIMGLTAVFAVPVGIAAAIYLEDLAKPTKFNQFIQLNIANLSGVPSIVYGLLGLAVFVRFMDFGRSVIAGALTMSLLILPTVIIVTQEALKTVPRSLYEGSMALGATQWQTIRKQVLPTAFPGILTGIILSISRAIGETAPLITIGALTYVAFIPSNPKDGFTALPIQIFNWASRPQEDFHAVASAGIIVLLVVLLSFNALAIYLRNKNTRINA